MTATNSPSPSLYDSSQTTTAQRIWSDSTCLLLIFAGGSAEFAVHPNVDWLFFTGKLPTDPIERFFSTIEYLRRMLVVSEEDRAPLAQALRGLHTDIEARRGDRIPDIAYRDVLNMDIFYSIVAADFLFRRRLTIAEKDEVVREMVQFGTQMGILNLPQSFEDLCEMRQARFADYGPSEFTIQLLKSYRKALGIIGYHSLLSTYPLMLERQLLDLMPLGKLWLRPVAAYGLKPLYRTGLIRWAYQIGLPSRLSKVVTNWQQSCQPVG